MFGESIPNHAALGFGLTDIFHFQVKISHNDYEHFGIFVLSKNHFFTLYHVYGASTEPVMFITHLFKTFSDIRKPGICERTRCSQQIPGRYQL